MSALSTPGGGGTTAQSKPTSGKQKYQKLDINSLYCANRNENSEPSSVKSQLSRKHGMQSLGKVPSTRRPPANLPSLKTETGQDTNANSISTTSTTVSSPPACTSQTLPVSASSAAAAAAGGWVPLPPPSSPHFRTEFPSLEAAAQPSHRPEHAATHTQLRPQTEGSWTCGGGARPGSPQAAPAPAAHPPYRSIMPSFLVKGSSGGGLGLGGLSALRERAAAGAGPGGAAGAGAGGRAQPRPPPTPRAVEVLTARPILRDEQISSLDDISRDAGWAQHDDIDYDQKLDFSDGESSLPNKGGNKSNNRANVESERVEKHHEAGDEEQLWAERRQKQTDEVAQAVARAKQRKEEEQRRQMRDHTQPAKHDFRDRNDHRDREPDTRDKDRPTDRMDRQDIRDKDRSDARDRDARDKERLDNRDRFDNRERDTDVRDRERDKPETRDRRNDNRERQERPEPDKDRMEARDRDRGDNRDRAERFDRERERDRDRDRDRADRDRDYRDRDREYARERDQNNPAFSKSFQANIPPRFLKQQQSRQQDEPQHKAWAFPAKPPPRRQEPPPYNAQRHPAHNGRRSYSRDYSDREDDFRRDKDGSGPQWRSEMQDYERSGRELDRSNSKDSYKDFSEYKGKNESDRKSLENAIDQSSRSAAEKLSEVFERKSIGIIEPFSSSESTQNLPLDRNNTPPLNMSRRESTEKDCLKSTSWAEVTQEEMNNMPSSTVDKMTIPNDNIKQLPSDNDEKRNIQSAIMPTPQSIPISNSLMNSATSLSQAKYTALTFNTQTISNNNSSQQVSQVISTPIQQPPIQQATIIQTSIADQVKSYVAKPMIQSLLNSQTESFTTPVQKTSPPEPLTQSFAKVMYTQQKSEKESSEVDSVLPKPIVDVANPTKKITESSSEVVQTNMESAKRVAEEKRTDAQVNVEVNRFPGKEPVERKSSGSGSEKKSRGFGGGGYGVVYNRGWGPRESRGRRSHRSSRSNNRASESDGSTDGTPNAERKERRRAPRSPRGVKKSDRPDDMHRPALQDQPPMVNDGMENREPFAPRGQPSRRGRGGFQGANRPPAPAKRVTGYGPPNTKSPFSQANRAVKDNDECKDITQEDKARGNNKSRAGSSTGRGRDRRPKAMGGPLSGEDENWETTSEHSEGGGTGGRRRSVPGRQQGQTQKSQSGRNQNHKNQNNTRNPSQGAKKDSSCENKTADITEAMTDLKLSTSKKDDDVVDDGFQEVRNKKNLKEGRGSSKEDNQQASKQHTRSHSNQGGGRNGSSSRTPNENKSNARGAPPVPAKNTQYDRPRQANLAPRFVKQRQKQQMGLVSGYGPDTGAAPPPPAVNAWDKPLRGNTEEVVEVVENKSAQSSQRSTPAEVLNDSSKSVAAPIAVPAEKSGVLDGSTPPVETIIFENTNYKSAPSEEALQQKYQMNTNVAKLQAEEMTTDLDTRALPFNGDVRSRPRSIQELIGDNGRPVTDAEASLGLQMSFDSAQKSEDSSDMKLDFAFDSVSDLGQLTEDKSKTLGLPRGVHISTSNTISPLAADLNLKIASVKKVWEMPTVAEGTESDLQFAGFEESNTDTGAPPNVCKVKPTQQLQSPPPQLYNHMGYQGGYGGLSVPSPPAMLFNSSQQLVGSSQQLQQQGGLYGAFLDQSRGQFGGFPGTPYGAGSATPYNYQPPPDMFQSLPNQYRMAATAGGGAAFGQSGQLGNNPSTVLISSTSNSLMSATVKPTSQQIGAIGSKGGGVGGVSAYQQQFVGYGAPVGEAAYSLGGLVARPAPPASSYYSPYQGGAAPAPTYPLQFTQQAQSTPFNSQFLSTLQAAAVQQMQVSAPPAGRATPAARASDPRPLVVWQQQYRAPPLQQQYAPPPRPPPQLKSPLHDHANGFAPLCDAASPTPKGGAKPHKPPHSPPHHKYHAPPPAHAPHQHHPQQMVSAGGRGAPPSRPPARYPAPIQRPHAPAPPQYRAPAHQHQHQPPRHHAPRHHLYYHHHQRNGGGGGGGERAAEGGEAAAGADDGADAPPAPDAPAPEQKTE